jgi:hypothetical protein
MSKDSRGGGSFVCNFRKHHWGNKKEYRKKETMREERLIRKFFL